MLRGGRSFTTWMVDVNSVSAQNPHTEHRVHQQVHAEEEIRKSNQQLPDHAASAMDMKGKDQVNYSCQNDEPRNHSANRNGCEKGRADSQHSENDQQNAPDDRPC